jgi:hypothetical protein
MRETVGDWTGFFALSKKEKGSCRHMQPLQYMDVYAGEPWHAYASL